MSTPADTNLESRAMARFATVFTHTFRSRLNAVLGSLELVSQTNLDSNQTRFIDTAVDSGRALLQLVNDTLDLVRMDADELRLTDAPLDLVAIVEGALGTVAARLHARGVALACIIDPAIPITLSGDGFRLRQVLANLLDNACKATSSGSVVLSVRLAPGDRDGTHLLFEVKDTGPGLPESVRANLFAPVLPSETSTSFRMSGLGVGLALCRRLVERMGGQITYAPRRGGGSQFAFDVKLQHFTSSQRTLDLVAAARDLRVLLVDPDAARRAAFGEQMQSLGMRVRLVADGHSAAEVIAQTNEFDLLLVHQDATAAEIVLRKAKQARFAAVLVPIGKQPRVELAPTPDAVLWLSSPMRLRTIIDAALGKSVPSIETPDLVDDVHDGARARVLVLEDSDANQMVMLARLQRLGCSCDTVSMGSDAVRLVSQRHYGLVLADLSLPDMSGLEVAAAIRQLGGDAARVPIVAVTGDTHPRDRERCLAAGMNDYLSKPVDQLELARVIDRYLPRSVPAQPVWDAEVIEQMAETLGRDMSLKVLAAYEQELGQRVTRLRTEMPLERLGREGHAMKSTAETFGAMRLAELARDLEQHSRNGQEAEARALLAPLIDMGTAVQSAIADWLQQANERAV